MRSLFRVVCLSVLAGGCGFSVSPSVPRDGGDDAVDAVDAPGGELIDAPDASVDAPDAFVPDARVCFGAGFGAVCLMSAPTQPLVLPSTTGFDTGGASCTEVVTVNTVELCVLAGTTVELPAASTMRAIGSRPLVVLATSTLTINGTLSVSSPRGSMPGAGTAVADCGTPAVAESDAGGAGGGAGGSFGGVGGNGGTGDTNDNGGVSGTAAGGSALAAIVPAAVRAGCPGADGGNGNQPRGLGGAAGGALYLIAGDAIAITGSVRAAGMGGGEGNDNSGGGGGGSGGLIGLDAPVSTVTGTLAANGGGGGEGGGFMAGEPGTDGTVDTTRAAGGSNNTNGGNGGLGSGGATLSGGVGADEVGGGGGGGGGAGVIYIKGVLAAAGSTISPPALVTP